MKRLTKLQINPEKVIKDDELHKLRGGTMVDCAVYYDGGYQYMMPFLCYGTQAECDESCADSISQSHPDAWCFCNYGY